MKDLEKIKDKLEKRQLHPSDDSWSKLEARLDQEQGHSKKWLWALAMAAIFVSGVFISDLFKTPPSRSLQKPITTRQNQRVLLKDQQEFMESFPQKITIDRGTYPIEKPDLVPRKKRFEQPVGLSGNKMKIHRTIGKTKTTSRLVDTHVNREKTSATGQTNSSKTDQLRQTIKGIMATAQEKNKTDQVSNAEIEGLLRRAQFKLRAEDAFKEAGNTVNAAVLLQEVEMELDKNLKERLFEAIHKGLNKARSAMASREN